jgi:hypothetical protein
MKNNIEMLEFSLKNPEPLIDDFYIKSSGLIISAYPDKPNKLMEVNRELLENITAFKVAENSKNEEMLEQTILKIKNLMSTKGINYSEFASFWSIVDISYSIYNSLSDNEKMKFLRLTVKKYLEMRHNIYLGYGYTPTALQVGKDAKSHKRSGSLGLQKCSTILNDNNYRELKKLNINDFEKEDRVFILTDKNGKKLFKEILSKYKIDFKWSAGKSKKMPDILFKNKNHIYIVEHKHMKEGGGGQDKQVSEVIDFINYSEELESVTVHYVTFLDGLYFNLFTKHFSGNDGKIINQLANIKQGLTNNPQNYFVNTKGFAELLSQIK